jgi:hypothetical protein
LQSPLNNPEVLGALGGSVSSSMILRERSRQRPE